MKYVIVSSSKASAWVTALISLSAGLLFSFSFSTLSRHLVLVPVALLVLTQIIRFRERRAWI